MRSQLSSGLGNVGARTIMRRIAMDYDRLAKLAEEQIANQERGTIDD